MQNENRYTFDCENLLFKCFAEVVRRKTKNSWDQELVIAMPSESWELCISSGWSQLTSKRKELLRARATLCGEGLRAASSAVRGYIKEVYYPHLVTGWIWKCQFLPQLWCQNSLVWFDKCHSIIQTVSGFRVIRWKKKTRKSCTVWAQSQCSQHKVLFMKCVCVYVHMCVFVLVCMLMCVCS